MSDKDEEVEDAAKKKLRLPLDRNLGTSLAFGILGTGFHDGLEEPMSWFRVLEAKYATSSSLVRLMLAT